MSCDSVKSGLPKIRILAVAGKKLNSGLGMSFEWDEAKRLSNRSKHGVDFPYAARIFLDTGRIEKLDVREDYGEDRYTVIGQIDGLIYLVAYTWRRQHRRIISARRASNHEQRIYYGFQPRS